MAKKSLPLSQVYKLIEAGPVVLLSTASKKRENVMPMSWHMMVEFEPPLLACIVSNRNATFDILKKTKECVINIPTADLVKKVVACGNASGRRVNKFKKFGLTPSYGAYVCAPLVDECYANLECKVVDTKLISKYNLFIMEVVKAWVDPSQKHPQILHHLGGGNFAAGGRTIKVSSKIK